MSELNLKIIELINANKSLTEIMTLLNINYRKLLIHLKQITLLGYDFGKNYYDNGIVIYELKKDLNKQDFKLNISSDNLRALFISDLHLNHINDDIKALDQVYEYAAKNDIHTIFNLGDLIQNIYTGEKIKNNTLEKQLKYVVKNYPYDKSIINYILYGNHDYYSLKENGINIGRVLEQKRFDLVSLGYGEAMVKIKNDSIGLKHDLGSSNENKIVESLVYFFGHSHRGKYVIGNAHTRKPYNIYIPSLSKVAMKGYEYLPLEGFMDVSFEFDKEQIKKIDLIQYEVDDNIRVVNKLKLDLEKTKKKLN